MRELAKCASQHCRSQVNGAKSLFKAELDGCLRTCGAADKKLTLLADEELKELKGCFQANNCKLPLEHLRQNSDRPQVKALRACAAKNCAEQVMTARSLGIGGPH